jgi:tRNA modification GTPase
MIINNSSDTIFAPITSTAKAAIFIIRISGEKSVECIKKLGFKGKIEDRKNHFFKIKDEENNILDQAIFSYFKAPNSFTGEDIIEISIHGSNFILKKTFQILLSIAAVRFAEAGEFSKRAFLNNKIDLTQAESIVDLIAAETKAQHNQAIKQLEGISGKIYYQWREELIEISAMIEAVIDFPEDDLPIDVCEKITAKISQIKNQINRHIDDKKIGEKIKEGIELAIIGSPNSGKSSLMNFLSKSDTSIVSPIAGTTRDIVEVRMDIAGFLVKISDTAGIRESSDLIEKEGIKRAINKANSADLKIYLIDATNPEFDKNLIDEKTILVINKIDLKKNIKVKIESLKKLSVFNILEISIKDNINLDLLFLEISKFVSGLSSLDQQNLITQERYRNSLINAEKFLSDFNFKKNIEFAAEDIRLACKEIGKIVGKVDIENILDVIFLKFCIGK